MYPQLKTPIRSANYALIYLSQLHIGILRIKKAGIQFQYKNVSAFEVIHFHSHCVHIIKMAVVIINTNTLTEYTSEKRAKIGRKAGIVGIASNLFLFALKLVCGILSSSVSIIADAVNNLSDALSSVILTVSYIFSEKPADKKHPYGHARIEYLSALFISIIVTILGIELFKSSVENIISGKDVQSYSPVVLIIMFFTVAVKLSMAVFYRVTGNKIDSPSLRASAFDSIGDAGATTAVILGIFLSPYTGRATDGIFGCIIALYILVVGIKLIKESSDTLLGSAPSVEQVSAIVSKLRSYDGVLGIHDLVLHNYGENRFFASVHLEMDAERNIMESHDLIDNIETDFAEEMGIHLVIHLDPVFTSDEKLNNLKHAVRDIIDEIACEYSSPISMHDFRAVFGITHSNLIFDIAVSHDMPLDDDSLCRMIRDGIKKLDETYNAVITIDRDYTTVRYH